MADLHSSVSSQIDHDFDSDTSEHSFSRKKSGGNPIRLLFDPVILKSQRCLKRSLVNWSFNWESWLEIFWCKNLIGKIQTENCKSRKEIWNKRKRRSSFRTLQLLGRCFRTYANLSVALWNESHWKVAFNSSCKDLWHQQVKMHLSRLWRSSWCIEVFPIENSLNEMKHRVGLYLNKNLIFLRHRMEP